MSESTGAKNGTIIITASSFASSNVYGGHFHSASAIAGLLQRDYDVILLNPGTWPSPVMQAPGLEAVFYAGSPERPGPLRARIAELIRQESVRAVVAFDQKAGELMRPLARRMKVGLVLVKPGGGQPRLYYPKMDHNIVFMAADKTWMEARNPPRSRVFMAAGRTNEPEQDLAAQAALRAEVGLSDNDMAILRIGRIEPHYGAVNRSALMLAARLRSEGLPARLVLVGTAENSEEHAALTRLKGPEDAILIEERFTDRASKLLGMFRFNVGTGRGFMEAAAMGQVMFCGSQDAAHELPLLVTDDNMHRFFDDNFSPRIKPDIDAVGNLRRVLEMAHDPGRQAALAKAARAWFEAYFSSETSRRTYVNAIEGAAHAPERFGADHVKSELHLRLSVMQDRLRTRLLG